MEAPLTDLSDVRTRLVWSDRKADLRVEEVTEGSQVSVGSLGEIVLPMIDGCFVGETDLDDLWKGKLREEGGAPRLDRDAPDLLDLSLSSSARSKSAATPARLLLVPTVSTFAQPCSRGFDRDGGFRTNGK